MVPSGRRSPRRLFALALGGLVAVLAACVAPSPAAAPAADAWVIVSFEDTADRFDLDVMDALLETELAADAALRAAAAGWIDGNEIGDHQYDLYFAGVDPDTMWTVLEPIFAQAPVPWTRVELRRSWDDASPRVLTP